MKPGHRLQLKARTHSSARHSTRYFEAGVVDGPLMIFVHGWPEIALMWKRQMQAFALEGWHCVAPDMRGYGSSAAPKAPGAYALSELVQDMVELHDHLGGQPAIWVGHDWGSPVVAATAAHHAERCRGVVLVSLPYFPDGFALPSLVPLVDRRLYPAHLYPDGQWDYFRFYLTHFEQTVSDMNADIPATLASLFRRGDSTTVDNISPSALFTRNGGRYGQAHRAPEMPPDPALWPSQDFDVLKDAFLNTGFRAANSWYLNDDANITYCKLAPDEGRLTLPVLFVNGDWDVNCNTDRSRLGEPMLKACKNLSVRNLAGGHWLPLECKAQLIEIIRQWLIEKLLTQKIPVT